MSDESEHLIEQADMKLDDWERRLPCRCQAIIVGLDGEWRCQRCGEPISVAVAYQEALHPSWIKR